MTSWATTTNWPTDLLRVGDLTCISLAELLDLAARMKSEPDGWSKALAGQSLAVVLDGPSMRTRLSAEAAAHRLGMVPVPLAPEDLEPGHADAIGDVARTLSTYVCAVVAHNVTQETLAAFARAASVPVINVHSPGHHPCQALADLLTLRERFGALEGLVLAYVGAANDVVRSLMEAGGLAGMHVRLACPPEYRPRVEDRVGAEILADRHGGSISLVADPQEAVAGADAVYTAPWPEPVRTGAGAARMSPYHVDGAVMRSARPHAVFMHCLPAHRGEEVEASVIDGRRAVVWEQVANRLPTEQAVIYALVTADRAAAAHEEVA
jgi:ornithine carbamoyltransferase